MKESDAKSVFSLAGFEVSSTFRLENEYWPEAYHELRAANPWWAVKTQFGWIKIGWRKRVMSISWTDLKVRELLIESTHRTQDLDMIHVTDFGEAVTFMIQLYRLCKKEEAAECV
jgi:hypothetical protein